MHARYLRVAVELLDAGWQDFDDLVRTAAMPRRDVEDLLASFGDDLERRGDAVRLRPGSAARYAPPPVSEPAGFEERVRAYVEGVPPPLPALDHVQATPETVLRRARWLDEEYDLRTTRLVFAGDHDLTSLAVHALRPEASLTVLDVDDRVLEYVDRNSGGAVRTVFADLRFGLPLAVAGTADVVFSDPPYTPEGMTLFASRGLECLADPARGRLVLAYGYSSRHPALGQQVQRGLLGLGLTFEAILPAFHRYTGAQAVGSAADLYVCQPTARAGRSRRGKAKQAIYTHGPQAVEATETPAALREGLVGLAAQGAEDGREVDVRGPDWTKPVTAASGTAVAIDLTADPGPWLVRVLLAVNADRVALLVRNAHPDLTDAEAQAALRALVSPKYRLRLLRSTPDNRHAVVVADAVTEDTALQKVWTRAHARLANVWPAETGPPPGADDLRLIDLPRHHLSRVVSADRR